MILFVCVFNIPMKKSKGNFGSVSHVAEGLDDRVSINYGNVNTYTGRGITKIF